MSFVPKGGFISVVPVEEQLSKNTLESRGFSSIVDISKIMGSKKKENLFLAFGSEDEEGAMEYEIDNITNRTPYKFETFLVSPKKNSKKHKKK